jgi:hypothetical protein
MMLTIVGFVALGLFLYVVITILMAWLEVKGQPKEEMFLCEKHGPIRKVHCITFLDTLYCPRCFHERLSSAEKVQ